jgi:hypothetical protein
MSKPKTLAAQRREAVELAFPGVICKRVGFECALRPAGDTLANDFPDGKQYSLQFTVEGAAETLVSHGFVEQKEIDDLPPSGRRSGLEKTKRGTYQACVHYHEWHEKPTETRDMVAKIALPGPPKYKKFSAPDGRWVPFSNPDGSWRVVDGGGAARPDSNVIPFPKKNPRAVSAMDSYLVDTRTVPGFVAIYVPSDLRANLIGSALACIGLRPMTEGGKLIARWDAPAKQS